MCMSGGFVIWADRVVDNFDEWVVEKFWVLVIIPTQRALHSFVVLANLQ